MLLFCITFCLTRNLPASKLPENVAVPEDVSNLNTSVVPSSTMKSTFVPPLNIKSPPPLVSKTRGTSISVPAVVIPPVFDISNCVAAAPSINLGVAVSTLKNGVVDPNVELTCNPVVSIPVPLRFVVSVPPVETPITSPLDLNKPVVRELSNVNDGVAAAPSLSFICLVYGAIRTRYSNTTCKCACSCNRRCSSNC